VLVVLAVAGSNTTESGRIRNLVKRIGHARNNSTVTTTTTTSTESSFMTSSALVAAESLQVQRQAFLSVILSYLARPEENPDALEGRDLSNSGEGKTIKSDEVTDENNNLTAGQSWSRFADSHIHLRVLRSTAQEHHQPEGRALFFRRKEPAAHPSSAISRRNNNPRRQFQIPGGGPPATALASPVSSAELAQLLRDNLTRQRRRNQLVNGEAEETSATIEVVQTRTPFVITNGEMIMNDLPMVH
jgi:hypothetical protein